MKKKTWLIKGLVATLGLASVVTNFGPKASVKADSFSGGDYNFDDRMLYGYEDVEKVWKPYDHLTNGKLNKQEFSVGQESTITFSFDCDVMPNVTPEKYRKALYLELLGPECKAWITTFEGENYKAGQKIQDSITLTFTEPGQYTFNIFECDQEGNLGLFAEQKIESFSINVKALLDENGSRVTDSLSFEKDAYSPDVKQSVTIEYTLTKPSHDYNLYIFEPGAVDYYDSSTTRIMDWYSSDGVLDTSVGEKCTKTFTYTFKKKGVYKAYLVDLTLDKKVAEASFNVNPIADFGIDESKVKDGQVPFEVSFTKNKTHLDLDANEKIKFSVQIPFKYEMYKEDYLRELKLNNYDESLVRMEDDKQVYTNVYINYQPVGSSNVVTLKKESVKGYLKEHTFEFSSEEILKLINENSSGDTAYAGIVSVVFSYNSESSLYLGHFSENVTFSVARSSKSIKASAVEKTAKLAYAEAIGFNVESDLGGEIVAEIYKGSKKIRTVKTSCSLDRAKSVGFGTIYWDLGNASGKYVAAGSYKVKLYTQVKLTTINNGKKSTKTVKSNKKTINFKVVKPTGALTLSSVATGLNGGEYATYENPLIGISNTVSIGSKIDIKIKNSKGTVIKNDSYAQPAGKYTRWYDLATLDSNLSIGKYTATITATIIGGKTVTKSISFTVEKSPKVELSNVSLSTKDGLGTVAFKTSQSSAVTVQIKNSSGKVVSTIVDGNYAAGTVKTDFNFGGYSVGNYSVVINAKNSGGTSTATKTFSVAKKPVVVSKPTISALAVRFTQKNSEDAYKVSCNYTAKNSKVVFEVMWNDAEQIVAIYECTTQKDNGSVEWIWDGYKSNGFRASAGSYTIRAYSVNSAGKTDYLRQNFTISEG